MATLPVIKKSEAQQAPALPPEQADGAQMIRRCLARCVWSSAV
jgi:hypothetical protein